MKRRNFFGLTVFGLVVLLIFLLFNPLSSSNQDIKKKKRVVEKGAAASVPDEYLEHKNPGKKPYVAPQTYVATSDETIGLKTVMDDDCETEFICYEQEGNFRVLDGCECGVDNLISNFSNYCGYVNPDADVEKSGNIYVAIEAYHISSSKTRIVVAKSSDYGKTWVMYLEIYNSSYYLRSPSIAIGEGTKNGRRLLVAYMAHTSPPRVEVFSHDLDTKTSTVQIPPYYTNPYANPIIKTDSPWFSDWYAYLVAEWHYDDANNNINIVYWRSKDSGLTWLDDSDNRKTIYGSSDIYEWRCPDLVFNEWVYITAYRKDTRTIYITKDNGINTQAITTLTYEPSGEVYPRIAGVLGTDNLMIVYLSKENSTGYDLTHYIYSLDNGTTWIGGYSFLVQDDSNTHMPIVVAPPNPEGYFHVIYTQSQAVYHYRRQVDLSTSYFLERKLVSDRYFADNDYPKKGIAAFHDNAHAFMVWVDCYLNYEIHGDRTYPDDFLGTWTGQGVYFKTERDTWIKMATPATLLTTGDLDDDGTDDPIGIWPGQGGVWVKYSSTGSWNQLSTTADWIATGDMNGDRKDDLLGTWSGQGVYYRDSVSGSWVKLATPATKITAGNLDGNYDADDLIGIWPGQGGVWVKYSSTGDWELLSSTAQDIAVGDMNGDGRDDFLGTWDGQGVYFRDAITGDWIKLATPATLITLGDLDSDGSDDLIGIWPGQGGVWAKYSSTGTWVYLSSTADSITAGMMRGGSGSWVTGAGYELVEPVGGEYINEPSGIPGGGDLLGLGPGAKDFIPLTEDMNLVPSGKEALKPGPGRPGFTFKTTPNLTPGEKDMEQKK